MARPKKNMAPSLDKHKAHAEAKQHFSTRPRHEPAAPPEPSPFVPEPPPPPPDTRPTAAEEDAACLQRLVEGPRQAEEKREAKTAHARMVAVLREHLGDEPDAADWAERVVLDMGDNARAKATMPSGIASKVVELANALSKERDARG